MKELAASDDSKLYILWLQWQDFFYCNRH